MYKTDQENFWSGDFGNDYILRNKNSALLSSKIALFTKIMSRTNKINSIIEFGSNIGLNLLAINALINPFQGKINGNIEATPHNKSEDLSYKSIDFSAVEINENACKELNKSMPEVKVYNMSILDFNIDYQRDFVFTSGVLIHINPQELSAVYKLLYETSKKYILINEYYNPSPVEVKYRGNEGVLFKRDFAGELMDKYPDLTLIDYGFVYHRDYVFPSDDLTWFLLQKK